MSKSALTENEAKEWLESIVFENFAPHTQKAILTAIDALEEIQKYRAIGTVKELQELKENSLSRSEIGTLLDIIQTLKKYEEIGTVEEFRTYKKVRRGEL